MIGGHSIDNLMKTFLPTAPQPQQPHEQSDDPQRNISEDEDGVFRPLGRGRASSLRGGRGRTHPHASHSRRTVWEPRRDVVPPRSLEVEEEPVCEVLPLYVPQGTYVDFRASGYVPRAEYKLTVREKDLMDEDLYDVDREVEERRDAWERRAARKRPKEEEEEEEEEESEEEDDDDDSAEFLLTVGTLLNTAVETGNEQFAAALKAIFNGFEEGALSLEAFQEKVSQEVRKVEGRGQGDKAQSDVMES